MTNEHDPDDEHGEREPPLSPEHLADLDAPLASAHPALHRIVAEARRAETSATSGLDFDAIERRTMASIARDQGRAGSTRVRPTRPLLAFGVAALAVAAGVMLFQRGAAAPAPPVASGAGEMREPGVPALAPVVRAAVGDLRIAGDEHAPAGRAVVVGESVEVTNGAALLEQPGKVTWLLASNSGDSPGRAKVTGMDRPLVVALERGTLEAQVTPVAHGQAFAVDVAAGTAVVRVAVHGTHFRVTRIGPSHVLIDLTEGVVSLGNAGAVADGRESTRLDAPAHASFDVTNLDGTLVVDHAPEHVARALVLQPSEVASVPAALALAMPNERPSAHRDPGGDVRGGTKGFPTKAPPGAPAVRATEGSTGALAAAVRDCAAIASKKRGAGPAVRVSVTSTLHVRTKATGEIESAQFEPPLLPEIQACAAATIYKLRLDETGLVHVPITFSY